MAFMTPICRFCWASSAETVNFSSGCLASGQAALDPANPLVSGDGKVNTSYIAKGCSGNAV